MIRFCNRDSRCVAIASLPKRRYNGRPLSPPIIHTSTPLASDPNGSAPRGSRDGVALESADCHGVEGGETSMEPMPDFAQLQLHFVDHIQGRYEVIRPGVLFADRTAA